MGKIAKYISIAATVLILSILVFRFIWGTPDSACFKIFSVEMRRNFLYKLIGFVPQSFAERYSQNVLSSYGNVEIINFVDVLSPIYTNHIVLKYDEKEDFLKAYPTSLLSSKYSQDYSWEQHMSFLIDLKVFNKYTRKFRISDRKIIMKEYCYFLSNPEDSSSYKIIENPADLDSIVLDFPLNTKESIIDNGYKIIEPMALKLENSDGIVYCWYLNKGIVKFNFTFDGKRIVKVTSIILGFLGNEYPSCC